MVYIYIAAAVAAEVLTVVFAEIAIKVITEVLIKLAAGGLGCCLQI